MLTMLTVNENIENPDENIESVEALSDRFNLIELTEPVPAACDHCGNRCKRCGWVLLDFAMQAAVPFATRDEALEYAADYL
jgi:hypothetical protein